MDLQTLTNLFASTYNSDPNIRKASELQIRKIAHEEGLISALLQIIASNEVDSATRQACTVWLKNRVHLTYFDESDSKNTYKDASMPRTDRENLKSSILPLLSASPTRAITLQIATVLRLIIQRDFPQRWPGLLEDVKRLLTSGNTAQIGAGCLAAVECIKAFRYHQTNDALTQVVEHFFPTLVLIGSDIASHPPSTAQEPPTMLHLILKAYKNSLSHSLGAHQQSQESLLPWGRLCFSVVNLQIPPEVVSADEDEREKSEWWKAKKWAYGCLCRLFHRYGNPSQLPSLMREKYLEFAQYFVINYAPAIFKAFLAQVEGHVANQSWLSKKVQYQIFSFFNECVKPASTWALLKPQYHSLVSSYVYPQLCFTSARAELWHADPVEYLRTSLDEYDHYATPVAASTSFLLSLATNRTKTAFLPIMSLINNVLRSNAPGPQRFGALYMATILAPHMIRHPQVKDSMENFMTQFVLPEFSSTEPYLRAIALEMLGAVAKMQMQWSSEENLFTLFRSVMVLVDDSDLPVRVYAITTMTEMINAYEEIKSAVSPQVGKIVQDLLKLSDETDLEALNHCLNSMVESFQEELLPVAGELTSRLCDSYMRLVKEAVSYEKTDGDVIEIETVLESTEEQDRSYAAMNQAKTLLTIIDAVDSDSSGSSEVLAKIQEIIVPIIVFTLEHGLLELFDNIYDLVDSITYKLRAIPPNMWPVFELTHKLFKSDGISWLSEMLPSLDNFVSFGAEVIKSRPDYKEILIDIYTTSLSSEHLGENDRVEGCKLAESVLLNLRGHVDEALQVIIVTALNHLDKAGTTSFRLANLDVLVNAILYNPTATMHIMESHSLGAARGFFDKWFAAINGGNSTLPRVHDKKLSIIALCALLEMDPAGVPSNLQDGWHGIVDGVLKIFKDLPSAIEKRQSIEETLEDEDDEDDGDELCITLNMDENDDDVWDEDSATLELLAREGERLKNKTARFLQGGSISDEESASDEEIEEELGYISPLDGIDPYIAFKNALAAFQAKNTQSYMASTASLEAGQQAFLIQLIQMADEHAAAAAAAAASASASAPV